MRKKLFAVVMAGIMVLSLAGCQKKSTSEETTTSAETSTVETAEKASSSDAKTNDQNASSHSESTAGTVDNAQVNTNDSEDEAVSGKEPTSEQPEKETMTGTEMAENAEQAAEQGKTWEDVLNDAGVTITDEMKEEYESISTPSLQTEYALAEVEGQKAKVEQYSEYLSVYNTLVTQMVTTPIIYTNESYNDSVADFKSARSTFDTVSQKDSISDDEFLTIKQKIVDAYNFLEQAQVTVGTSAKNDVKAIQKELEGQQ